MAWMRQSFMKWNRTEQQQFPPSEGPGYQAWIEAFNAEADEWIASCRAQDEDDQNLSFIALVSRASEAMERFHGQCIGIGEPVGPPKKNTACERLIVDLWYVIERLRYAETIYSIAWYKRKSEQYYRLLENFSDLVPAAYLILLRDEIQDSLGRALRAFDQARQL